MRLIEVKIDGYKRLRDVHVFVDQALLAVVGANEAGKSSFLGALHMLTKSDPVPAHARSRSGTPVTDDHVVIGGTYHLDDADLRALAHLELTESPKRLTYERKASGAAQYVFDPTPKRDTSSASQTMMGAFSALREDLDRYVEETPASELVELGDYRGVLVATLDASHNGGSEYDWTEFDQLLEQATAARIVAAQPTRASADEWKRLSQLPRPIEGAWEALKGRRPRVLNFNLAARSLKHTYALDDADQDRTALENLLWLGGSSIADIEAVLEDVSRRETLVRRINAKLRQHFSRNWSQSKVSPQIRVAASAVNVVIEEDDSYATVAIVERSDGLRTFVALTAFIAAEAAGRPSILLIDEAETHLHLNAQADLVNVLSSREDVDQVIYTTHSPGCLPRDLGRGIRLIEPSSSTAELSVVRHDFWNQSAAQRTRSGFSPLLFAMGAGAAVFASLRSAVVAEGPTEMILLPSLIRLATNLSDLPYQVAPGIAQLDAEVYEELRVVATNVCYLVDGDSGGRRLKRRLQELGTPEASIFSLPKNATIEDMVQPEAYLTAISDLSGIELGDFKVDSLGIRSAVKAYLASQGAPMPGPIAVAEHLVGPHGLLNVAESARQVLVDLHTAFVTSLRQQRSVIDDAV